MENNSTDRIVSYHTYVLPFVWEGDNPVQNSFRKFSGIFENNPNWLEVSISDETRLERNAALLSADDALLYYKEYQYFHPYVRNAIYGFDKGIVRKFSFLPEKVRNKATYCIEKYGRRYLLFINAINLKIFNTGIALFVLECENHGFDADGKSQDSLADVNSINDYGRRISLPFIPVKSADYYSICADRLTLSVDGVGEFSDDMSAFAKSLNSIDDIYRSLSFTHMCDYIKSIIGFGSDFHFTSKPSDEKNDIYIYPALDDRMFVACEYINKEFTDDVVSDGKRAFLNDTDISKKYYGFVFIDPGKECTCQDMAMRTELLSSHAYTRWADSGTLYSVAAQGITLLINDNVPYLTDSFLTQYIQMSCLCLAQRATLIHFQRLAAKISSNIEEKGKKINKKTVLELMNLQERFVAYQSQLSFSEVTPQEQGIEVYDKLREFMFIEKETETLGERMEKLEAAADTNLDFSFNKIALIFTFVSVILSLCGDYILGFFGNGEISFGNLCLPLKITLICIPLCVAFSFLAVTILYRRRK